MIALHGLWMRPILDSRRLLECLPRPRKWLIQAAREWMDKAFKNAAKTIDAHSEAEWDAPLPEGPIMGGHRRFFIFGAIRDHTAHHRGALTVYARLLGKVPPMPYMEM